MVSGSSWKQCEHQHEQPALQTGLRPSLEPPHMCLVIRNSLPNCPSMPVRLAKCNSCQKTAWSGQASRATEMKTQLTAKEKIKKKKKKTLPLWTSSSFSKTCQRHCHHQSDVVTRVVEGVINVCVRVCVNTEPFSSPLDITVSSLISGLFEDCEKLDWTNYCVAHIVDHAGIFKKKKKKGLTDSLDVQPFIAVTNINVM